MAYGLAQTSRFMLGTTSILMGPQANLFDLTPALNGLGLVKNFKINSEPGYVELTQGIQNSVVMSVMNKYDVKASCEVYEYTLENLNNAMGLDGSAITLAGASTTTTGSLAGGGTVLAVAAATGITTGTFLLIRYGADDQVLVREVLSVASLNVTLTRATPASVTVPSGAVVQKMGMVSIGKKVAQPFLSAMVIGELADGTPAAIALPKVRVTKGFDLTFASDNYGNMPFEFTVYDQVATDPYYTVFGGDQARFFTLP